MIDSHHVAHRAPHEYFCNIIEALPTDARRDVAFLSATTELASSASIRGPLCLQTDYKIYVPILGYIYAMLRSRQEAA